MRGYNIVCVLGGKKFKNSKNLKGPSLHGQLYYNDMVRVERTSWYTITYAIIIIIIFVTQ